MHRFKKAIDTYGESSDNDVGRHFMGGPDLFRFRIQINLFSYSSHPGSSFGFILVGEFKLFTII
eukprot:snap_masked-scaffold_5-processed-gene-1.38-mRNA-1 protein AED:1.00 eAED:1.00 QI:0/0/0/0/1/1/2/0/63